MIAAEKSIWGVIIGIALGQEASTLLKWFSDHCYDEFANLQANVDNLEKFFLNGVIDPPDLDEDMEMILNASLAGPQSVLQDVTMEDAAVTQYVASVTEVDQGTSPQLPPPPPPTPHTASVGQVDPSMSFPPPPPPPPSPPAQEADAGPSEDGISSPVPQPVDDHIPCPYPRALPGSVGGSPLRTLSPLSSLSESESDPPSEEDAPPPEPKMVEKKSSGRVGIPSQKFTSGASLTQAPLAKKRKREIEMAPPFAKMNVATKEEELYWTTAFAQVTAAVCLLRYHLP